MKVLLVHNSYQQPGGEDQVFASEHELLASRGHDVVRYSAHNNTVGALSRLRLGVRTSWSRTAYREMAALLKREQPQIVHVHNTLPLLSPAVYYAARAAGLPVVQTLHNYRLLCPKAVLLREQRICEDCVGRSFAWPAVLHGCYRESRAASTAVAVMLGVHRWAGTWTRTVTRYIALTEFMRQKFITGGFPADRIVVKPNFVAPDPGVGDHGGRYALFVGRLSPEKGVQTLVRAWDRVGDRMRLRIAGDGPLRTLAHGSAAGIEWLGQLSREQVAAHMQQASVLVFPAEWYEPFGLAIAEAFATGLPVVASRIGAMTEIVRDGHTGLFFDPGDALDLAAKIAWASDHPAELSEMGRRARQEYESKYCADRNYQLLQAIYQQVLEQPSGEGNAVESAGSARTRNDQYQPTPHAHSAKWTA